MQIITDTHHLDEADVIGKSEDCELHEEQPGLESKCITIELDSMRDETRECFVLVIF